jgi:HEAT repeat protein
MKVPIAGALLLLGLFPACARASEDSPTLPELVSALRDTVPIERIRAINGIADRKDAGDAEALLVLDRALHDPDDEVRMSARYALHYFKSSGPALVERLAAAVAGPDTSGRGNAARALGHVAVLSARALPLLLRMDDDRAPAVRAGLGEGLDAVKRVWPGQVPALAQSFARCDPDMRYHVGTALAPAGPAAVPALLPLVASPDWNVRANTARVLGLVGETDGAVARALDTCAGDSDYRVRGAALQALGRLGTVAAHDALVRRGGSETHGPAEITFQLGGSAVKPGGSIVALGAAYKVMRRPLARDGRLDDVVVTNEHRLYVCDIDARTVRLLARIEPPEDMRSGFGVGVRGWSGDSVVVSLNGEPARDRSGFRYASVTREALVDPAGGLHVVPKAPHIGYVEHYRDVPGRGRRFLYVHHDGIEVQFDDRGPHIPVFRVDPATHEILPTGP